MQARTLALAVVIAIAVVSVPAAVPALEDFSVTGEADAAKCIMGDDGCIIPVYCVRDCDGDPRE